MNRATFGDKDLLTVKGDLRERHLGLLSNTLVPDNEELSMVFQFEHIGLLFQERPAKWNYAEKLNVPKLKKSLTNGRQTGHGRGLEFPLFGTTMTSPRIVSAWGR